jgi:hypothetical protein
VCGKMSLYEAIRLLQTGEDFLRFCWIFVSARIPWEQETLSSLIHTAVSFASFLLTASVRSL